MHALTCIECFSAQGRGCGGWGGGELFSKGSVKPMKSSEQKPVPNKPYGFCGCEAQ